MTFALIGAGAIGNAVRFLLERAGHSVRAWDADPARADAGMTPAAAVENAEAVFLCVPSWAVSDALRSVQPHVSAHAAVVALTKGVEPESGLFMDAFLQERLPGRPVALLAGPMLAAELREGNGGAACVASPDMAAARRVSAWFDGSGLRAEPTDDLAGVAAASVLKNVYALGLGMAAALGWGENKRGWFAGEAVREMARLLPVFGGRTETALSPAGAGDLIATGFSPASKNHAVGAEIARTGTHASPSEGSAALPALERRVENMAAYPLLQAVADAAARRRTAAEALEDAFTTPVPAGGAAAVE